MSHEWVSGLDDHPDTEFNPILNYQVKKAKEALRDRQVSGASHLEYSITCVRPPISPGAIDRTECLAGTGSEAHGSWARTRPPGSSQRRGTQGV